MWQTYLRPADLDETLPLLRQYAGAARIVAGGTDVLVQLSRGVNPTTTLIDISALRELKYVRDDGALIRLGGLATHNDVLASHVCVERALPLAQACWEVGAPQIRTRATVAGNLVTASPANDTITPLIALDAEVALVSVDGERVMPLREFYAGFRQTVLRPDELLREIRVPALQAHQRGLFLKLGLRRAQAISVINVALVLSFDGDIVTEARVALGCLAPTIVRAPSVEGFLAGRRLDAAACAEAGRLAANDVTPIDDVRGSAAYRSATLAGLIAQGLARLAATAQAGSAEDRSMRPHSTEAGSTGPQGTEARNGGPRNWMGMDAPVLLYSGEATPSAPPFTGTVATTINGRPYRLAGAATMTLLNALREEAGLTGTKEGCAEGECGACTVWLNGQAVMSCLVPAAQAHGGAITTIEGLAGPHELHPLQSAFIAHGAVQCGYCIPGMLMAGAKLLQERPQPTLDEARVALSGNLCRCTGYRKILDAVLAAGGARE